MTIESKQQTAFLTGGTGFLGFNIAKLLVARDWQVITLHRQTSSLAYLNRLPVIPVVGDILKADAITRAMPENVDAVFHVAADLNMWSRRNAAQTAVNVDGTNNLLEAALTR